MIKLNDLQKKAVEQEGNVVVTACPGSGKTRVLISRIIRGLDELTSNKHRIVAMTFTNRATDEIQSRLDQLSINYDQLWAGTIHAFALEWILRPYAAYVPRLQKGFSIADEYHSDKILKELKKKYNQKLYYEVNTARDREGNVCNDYIASKIFEEYQKYLKENKLLDYDDILFYAYYLLNDINEIPYTLSSIIRLFCVDEIQDTQDLQYGILSKIFKASPNPPSLFFVGDPDQSIYESLGSVTKTNSEIEEEFELESVIGLGLTGNYRSTQRIIDYYQTLRPGNSGIQSLTKYAKEQGIITFHDHTVSKDDLPSLISQLVNEAIFSGVPQNEICVLAPQWWHVRALARSLVQLLPDVDFDAPGLSPFHCQRENIWFKIARLFLTDPSPNLYRTRLRWAREIIEDLNNVYTVCMSEELNHSRTILRIINSIVSSKEDGLDYLDEVFNIFLGIIQVDINFNETLFETRNTFFEKAKERIESGGDNAPSDVHSFKKLFKHPSGIVISTCHGVKGEEYDTVIAFGLLKGYIPNWNIIIHGDAITADDRASKLLYVICSRAKRKLHLIAESGRLTRSNNEYETTSQLRSINFGYDSI